VLLLQGEGVSMLVVFYGLVAVGALSVVYVSRPSFRDPIMNWFLKTIWGEEWARDD
jgi:hypothetical protein